MIKKRETCLYCGAKMESVTAKKKFCSPMHRLYYHRELKRGTLVEQAIEPVRQIMESAVKLKSLATVLPPATRNDPIEGGKANKALAAALDAPKETVFKELSQQEYNNLHWKEQIAYNQNLKKYKNVNTQ